MNAISRPSPRTDVVLLGLLYAAEFFALAMALSLHRLGDRSLASSIFSTPGLGFLVSLIAFVSALALIAYRYRRARRSGSRGFGLTVAMNLITLALVFIPVEIAVRLLVHHTPDTTVFRNTVLLPRSWQDTAASNQQVFDKASGDLSYLVYDDALGWTVGANRRGGDGMYLSSAEGLRAASQGAVLAGPKMRHRVAIVGDSFVFAERVTFEDSWGHLLEANSGGKLEVLNFGVGGYAIDQAYLRFKKDILGWQPDIAILAFPLADFHRTVTVYPFINWPEWGVPFSKPRIVRDGSALKVLNFPTIAPPAMFSKASIADLPLLGHDAGYRARDWRWSLTDASYAKRALFSALAPGSQPGPQVSEDELIGVNAAILQAFIKLANENGIIPMIAYLPSWPEIERLSRGGKSPGLRIMHQTGVAFVDATPCVLEVGAAAGYVPDDPHYSARGNAAVAKCIGSAVEQIVAQRPAPQPAAPPRQ